MAKKAINAALSDLSKSKLEEFCEVLIDRKEEPRIRRCAIEDKSKIQITDRIVSTFTDSRAVDIVLEILKEIDCNTIAEELKESWAKQSRGTTASVPEPKGAAASVPAEPKGAAASVPGPGIAFVKKYRTQLIDRVTSVPSILDLLLENGAIKHEIYNLVRSRPTKQEQMREIYEHLQNDKARQILYEALKAKETFLIEELSGN